MLDRNQEHQSIRRRFVSDLEVEAITGISRRTLQKDRLLDRDRFPWYKVGRKVLYDLDEVEAIIRRAGKGGTPATADGRSASPVAEVA
jgi:predicted DNA-binding transcriptional regulator AlpA